MKRLVALTVIVVALTGCNDPLGMTSREQSRTDAIVAQGDSSARIAEANRGAIEAQEQASVEKSRIDSQQHAFDSALEAAKPNYMPIYFAFALIGGIAAILAYWLGRSFFAATVSNGSTIPQYRIADNQQRNRLLRAWHEGNYQRGADGRYYIEIEGRTYRALLPQDIDQGTDQGTDQE